jgi:hypothetical protein
MEAFNALDYFFSGLIPEIEINEENRESGVFVWVCAYGGMQFYRKITWAEEFQMHMSNIAKLN